MSIAVLNMSQMHDWHIDRLLRLEDAYPGEIHEISSGEFAVSSMMGWRLLTKLIKEFEDVEKHRRRCGVDQKQRLLLDWYAEYPDVPRYHEDDWADETHEITIYSREWFVNIGSLGFPIPGTDLFRVSIWCGRTENFVRSLDPRYTQVAVKLSAVEEFIKIVKPSRYKRNISKKCTRFWEGLVYLIDEGFIKHEKTIQRLRAYITKLAETQK